ncbi:MAG: cytochrome d ubiquinol oxidase subunit II, partial [Myxococcales bacterium]
MSTDAWVSVLWSVMGLAALVYVLTGGADLGAGVWHVLARGPRRDAQREAIRHAVAPIWEANHVWLIFLIVAMFSAFPTAFAVVCVALHLPLVLMLVGLVFRGAAFVFQAYGISSERTTARWQRVFAWSSTLTPPLIGAMIAAVSSGAIRLDPEGRVTSSVLAGWTTPFAALVGLFALALFALVAAVYLAAETAQGSTQSSGQGSAALSWDFARRALAAEVVAGALAAATFANARSSAPELFASLARAPWTVPVQLATAASALATCGLLLARRPSLARAAVVAQVGLVVLV